MKKRQRVLDSEDWTTTPPPKHGRNDEDIFRLGELLSLDYFLHKVLLCLVDDGLNECRRVCRLWRDAVNQLPVNLILRSGEAILASKIIFPNAASIFCSGAISTADIEDRARQKHGLHSIGGDAVRDLLEEIASFPRLRRLHLNEWLLNDGALEPTLAELTNLTALDIAVLSDVYTYADCLRSLRHLPRLKELSLGLQNHDTTGAEPLIGLTGLESLTIHGAFLAKPDGTLFFPSLTRLTSLSLRALYSQQRPTFHHGILSVVAAYQTTLKRLELRPPFLDDVSDLELLYLPRLTQLESLKINGVACTHDQFWSALSKIKSLTEFDCFSVNLHQSSVVECIFSLTGLRSLTFGDALRGADAVSLPSFSNLSRLTKLHVLGMSLGDLSCLPHLVDLRISEWSENQQTNIDDTLRSVPKLKRLQLYGRGLQIPTSLLRSHVDLSSLTLTEVAVETDVFDALCSLSNLRTLRFGFPENNFFPYSQINRLSALQQLSIYGRVDSTFYAHLMEGKLKRLRYLEFRHNAPTTEQAAEMKLKLPCLRKITSLLV